MMTEDQEIVRRAILEAGKAPGNPCQTSRVGNVVRFHGWTGCDPSRFGRRTSVKAGAVAFGVLIVGEETGESSGVLSSDGGPCDWTA